MYKKRTDSRAGAIQGFRQPWWVVVAGSWNVSLTPEGICWRKAVSLFSPENSALY